MEGAGRELERRRATGCAAAFALCVAIITGVPAWAQPAKGSAVRCIPVSERAGRELGCWITATSTIDELPATPYWYLDAFPDRATAQASRGARSVVVESLGRIWLFTIEEAGWRAPSGGERVATIGPLPIRPGARYAVQYMEGLFTPGMQSAVHRHSGPEAFYAVAGRMCLETPDGRSIVGPGESAIVPEGPPMVLTGIGTEQRRSLVLILHDASRPPTSLAPDWTPQGLCRE